MIMFRKTIPVEGFEWRSDLVQASLLNPTGTSAVGPFLVDKGDRGRVTSPLEAEPKMFEAFADLAKGREENLQERILLFANRYGSLGRALWVMLPNVETTPTWVGEDFALWREEIRDLNLVFRIWRCVKERNMQRLGRTIHREGTGVIVTWKEIFDFTKSSDYFGKTKYAIYNEPGLDILPGDLIAAANFILQKLINEKVTGHISPRVIRDEEFNLQADFVPDSLLSAIWMQMFNAVTGVDDYIQCEVCGGLIEKKPGGRASKRVHTRCAKMRSAQLRKGKADPDTEE